MRANQEGINVAIKEKQEQINTLMQEVADLACPFEIGDIIEASEGDFPGKYKIVEILPRHNDYGFALHVRKISEYGYVTLIYREIRRDLEYFHLPIEKPTKKKKGFKKCPIFTAVCEYCQYDLDEDE